MRDALAQNPNNMGFVMNRLVPVLNSSNPSTSQVAAVLAEGKTLLNNTKPAPEEPMGTSTGRYGDTGSNKVTSAGNTQLGLLAQLRDAVSIKPELNGLLYSEILPVLSQKNPSKEQVKKAIADAQAALSKLQNRASSEDMALLASLRDAVSTKPELNGLLYSEILPVLSQKNPSKEQVKKAIADAEQALAMLRAEEDHGMNVETSSSSMTNTAEPQQPEKTQPAEQSQQSSSNTAMQSNTDTNYKSDSSTISAASNQAGQKSSTTSDANPIQDMADEYVSSQKAGQKMMKRTSKYTTRMALYHPEMSKTAKKLPQTGEANGIFGLLGGVLALLGMSVLGFKKKQED